MISLDMHGQLAVKQQIELLKLNPKKRKRINGQMGRKVRVLSRKRLREQKGLNGRAWEPRKARDKGQSKKMMRKTGRGLVTYYTADSAVITLKSTKHGRIAYAQQHGIGETFTASRAKSQYGEPDYQAPATKKQARALRDAGYKRRRENGKGWVKPSLTWIAENLKLGQAGLILRILRDEQTTKNSWVIKLPERSFLGVTEQEIKQLVQSTMKEATKV